MKVLFAVKSESVANAIINKYQKEYKEILSVKKVYFFNAVLKEIQKDKSYDRIIISEDLEPFTNNSYDSMDKFLFEKLDTISDEAEDIEGNDTPIIYICGDRRTKGDAFLVKIFGIGIYNALLENDRSTQKVCELISKPRLKKAAKIYYGIDSDDVSYAKENESEVNEMELQNILVHFKKLGKTTDKYADSFENIAQQYTDEQLIIIANCLPLNVKSVLERESPKYQELMEKNNIRKVNSIIDGVEDEPVKQQGVRDVKLDAPPPKINGSIVIPVGIRKHSTSASPIKKTQMNVNKVKNEINAKESANKTIKNEEENKKQPVKAEKPEGEIRIKKVTMPDGTVVEKKVRVVKKSKEKPDVIAPFRNLKKNQEIKEVELEEDDKDDVLPGFGDDDAFKMLAIEEEQKNNKKTDKEDDENINATLLVKEDNDVEVPSLDDEDNDDVEIPSLDDEDDDDVEIPSLDDEDDDDVKIPSLDDEDDDDVKIPSLDDEDDVVVENSTEDNLSEEVEIPDLDDLDDISISDDEDDLLGLDLDDDIPEKTATKSNNQEIESIKPNVDYSMSNLNSLLTKDKKIVTFIGTTKNGTSFIVNNLALLFSAVGINTAILDMTKNKNSYYLYTDDKEELKKTASQSIDKLINGYNEGIKVNNNLSVFTALPNDGNDYSNAEAILSTLVQNFSLILIDCDFDTDPAYFASCQEIYLIQSMDVMTIQPLTAFLHDLQRKGVFEPEKVRIVVNKEINLKDVSTQLIINGMSSYMDPAQSILKELFNVEMVKKCSIPFDVTVYSKYLNIIATCKISISDYPKAFMEKLKNLANMVYPLVGKSSSYGSKNNSQVLGKKPFSKNTNSTLDKMKKKF